MPVTMRDLADKHAYNLPAPETPFRRGSKDTLDERLDFLEAIALPSRTWECIVWPFALSPSGYGLIKPGHLAHRYVCEKTQGPAPSRKHLAAHDCGLRMCVNPLHIQWKTPLGNAADKRRHGTASGWVQPRRKLSMEQAREIKGSNSSMAKLADRYGVSKRTIQNIKAGRFYKK